MHGASSTQFSANIIVIQGDVLSSGLLAELPAILDSFFTNTTSDFIGVIGWGWWGAIKTRSQVVTLPYGYIGALDSPKTRQFSG